VKIDASVFSLIFQTVGFLVTICLGYGGFVALKKDVEHLTKSVERIEENQAKHALEDKERFTEIGVLMKADQAATANIHESVRDTRWELRNLQDWRDRIERRNGPQPPAA
jgi:hypothetical protein